MAMRNIIIEGDEVLAKECKTVTAFDERLSQLIDDLKDTLKRSGGAGLAASQVAVLRRVAVVCIDGETFYEIVNPEIVYQEGEKIEIEGCLSIPGVWGTVKRPYKIRVHAQDRFGNDIEIEAEDFLAKAFCHEIDHLSGILFTDNVIEYIEVDD